MTNAELIQKIRNEIERLIEESDFDESANLYSLLSFLDTLESEKPFPNDLEEAAMNYIAPIENEDGLKVINFSGQDIKDAFIAGAEWRDAQIPKLPNDVDKAAEEYTQRMLESWRFDSTGLRPLREPFKAGADWQKEHMLKEAVEGFIFQPEDYYPKELLAHYDGELKHGDKVRIIIVKEDGK